MLSPLREYDNRTFADVTNYQEERIACLQRTLAEVQRERDWLLAQLRDREAVIARLIKGNWLLARQDGV